MDTMERIEIALRMLASLMMIPSVAFFIYQTFTEGKYIGTSIFGILLVALVVFLVMTVKDMKHSY